MGRTMAHLVRLSMSPCPFSGVGLEGSECRLKGSRMVCFRIELQSGVSRYCTRKALAITCGVAAAAAGHFHGVGAQREARGRCAFSATPAGHSAGRPTPTRLLWESVTTGIWSTPVACEEKASVKGLCAKEKKDPRCTNTSDTARHFAVGAPGVVEPRGRRERKPVGSRTTVSSTVLDTAGEGTVVRACQRARNSHDEREERVLALDAKATSMVRDWIQYGSVRDHPVTPLQWIKRWPPQRQTYCC